MLVRNIEKAMALAELNGYQEKDKMLCKAALVHLFRKLEENKKYRALVLGGDLAVLVFHFVNQLRAVNVDVTNIEHEELKYNRLKDLLGSDRDIQLVLQNLKIIPDNAWELLFNDWQHAAAHWEHYAAEIPNSLSRNCTLHNAFYGNIAEFVKKQNQPFDVLVVDGPQGNGRSLAFPLLANSLKENAWVLIDDFDYYPFLDYLSIIYTYTEHYREIRGKQHWVLLQLTGKK